MAHTDSAPGEIRLSRRALLIGLGVCVLLWGVLTYSARHYALDDGLIYLRYVRNLQEHGELSYNLGERFNGLTSPLFTLVIAGLVMVFGHPVVVVNLTCGVFLLGAALVTHRVVADCSSRCAGTAAMAFVLSSPFFYQCFGLETSLFLLLFMSCVYLFFRRRWLALAIYGGLLLTVRSEGGLLIAALMYVLWRDRMLRWQHWPLLVPLVVPMLCVTVFNWWYFGQAMPHTLLAKFGQGISGYWGRWPRAFLNVRYHADWFWGGKVWLILGVLGLAAVGAARLRGSALSRVGLVFLGAYGAFFVALNVPNYHWYYAAFYLFLLLYAGVGSAHLIELSLTVRVGKSIRLPVVCSLLCVAAVLGGLAREGWLATRSMGTVFNYRASGEWIAAHTASGTSVAAAEIGTLGWYSRRPIVDILGLVTPGNAEAVARHDLSSWLERNRPSYILIHVPATVFESAAVEAMGAGRYQPVTSFPLRGLILLERLVHTSPPEPSSRRENSGSAVD
jgi:arabinofuranosyltransferase